ncbi:hepatocyte cell adhesion molecule-like isoform X2 [Scyliorhinus canicula]|uniref:hepatocyte cell adhesion molecule-like isoform X2 n=1 Tax=Scyliorhinus canicula TaxID=7830 RepID=UPI0018F3CCA6|nr:hepatocyte cell adhesion molecule-like isoform X2 [Scyliorhinus canicula]
MRLGIVIRVAWIIHLQPSTSTLEPYYHLTTRYSSVLLSGDKNVSLSDQNRVIWFTFTRSKNITILTHDLNSGKIERNPFYGCRMNYNQFNASLEIFNLRVADSGLYAIHIIPQKQGQPHHFQSHILEVQEILPQPLIIQDIIGELKVVYLNCFVKYGETNEILWLKEGQPLQDDETHKLLNGNGTLMINRQRQMKCEMYTCVVRNKVSQKESSHPLTVDVYRRQLELTTFFIFFQMIAFIFLLIAALLCISDPVYHIASKIVEGIGFFFVSGTIIYVNFYYLQPQNELKMSFLLKTKHHNFFLVYGIFCVIISAVPIYREHQNIPECQPSEGPISGTIAATVVVYLFIVGLSFVFLLKYMMSWPKYRRISRTASQRSSQRGTFALL